MNVVGVTDEDFPYIYASIKWAFDSFAKRSNGTATAEDLAGQVMARTSQCWMVWDDEPIAVALTEVQESRKKTVCMTHCAGRDREDWQEDLVNEIKAWAKHIGAERFATVNRPGWTPFLRQMGLRETHRLMEQNIE